MTSDEKLANSLKMKFGLAPNEPTMTQLAAIKSAINQIAELGRTPSVRDWARIVTQYCPGAGRHKYAGVDNSDLNTLLALATQAARGN